MRGLDNLFASDERPLTRIITQKNDSESDDSDEEHEVSLKRRIPCQQPQRNKESRTESKEDVALRRLLSGRINDEDNEETMVQENNIDDGDNLSRHEDDPNVDKDDENNPNKPNDENEDPNEDSDTGSETETNVDDVRGKLSYSREFFNKLPREALKLRSYNKSPPDSSMKDNLLKSARR